jgi:hypothetical protein
MRNNSRSSFSRPSDRRGPSNNSGGSAGGFRRNGRPVNYGAQRRSGGNRNGGTYINPEKFVNKAVTAAEEVAYVPTNMFADFKVSWLHYADRYSGWRYPSYPRRPRRYWPRQHRYRQDGCLCDPYA